MEKTAVKLRLKVILAADVVAYSGKMGANEEGTLTALNANLLEKSVLRSRTGTVGSERPQATVSWQNSPGPWMQRNAPSTSKKVKARGNEGLMDEDQLRFRTSANLGDVIVQDGDIFGNGIDVGRPTGRFPNPA